jgi:hypothetical protein
MTKGLRIPRPPEVPLLREARLLDEEDKGFLPAEFGSDTARHAARQLRAIRLHRAVRRGPTPSAVTGESSR